MRTAAVLAVALWATLALLTRCDASALGVYAGPTYYPFGANVTAYVDSYRTRLGLTPHNFYSIPFPQPDAEVMKNNDRRENLGAILLGVREQWSSFSFEVGKNVTCRQLGTVMFDSKAVKRANDLARNAYYGMMSLDELPVVSLFVTPHGQTRLRMGYRFGDGTISPKANATINNFLSFTITYVRPKDSPDSVVITRFTVQPKSALLMDRCDDADFSRSNIGNMQIPRKLHGKHATLPVTFYYGWTSVEDTSGDPDTRLAFLEKSTAQKSRQSRGHWTAAINAIVLVVVLGVAVAVVLARTVRKDLMGFADEELVDELRDEAGWKLVGGEVFRPPHMSVLLACVIAAGCQTVLVFVGLFLLMGVGLARAGKRGSVLTGIIVTFLFSNFIAGYVGACMLKFFKKQSWANGLLAISLFPLSIGTGYMVLNCIHWWANSTSAIPIGSYLSVLAGFLLLSVPLGVIGLTMGFRAPVISAPTKINAIPRLIPGSANKRLTSYILVGGLVPFSACFIEVVYVMAAFWQGDRFHMFGFLAVVGVIVAFLCMEIGVVVTYLTLNSEDYRWWWRSFFSLASAGLYLYLYGIFYLFAYLELKLISSLLLFSGYMIGVSVVYGLMCGTCGFLASAAFARIIYSASKSD